MDKIEIAQNNPLNELSALSIDEVFLQNFNCNEESLKEKIQALFSPIKNAIKKTLNTHADYSFECANILGHEKQYFNFLALKLFDVTLNQEVSLLLTTNLARKFIFQLFFQNYNTHESIKPFSETEKGIFLYIITKLFVFLPDNSRFKIIGIFNQNDDEVLDITSLRYYSLNFTFNFLDTTSNISIILSKQHLEQIGKENFNKERIAQFGFIRRNLELNLKLLKTSMHVIKNIRPFDLIFFEHKNFLLDRGVLNAKVYTKWENLWILGEIKVLDDNYIFEIIDISKNPNEEISMEKLSNSSFEIENDLENIAEDIEVEIKIQLSSIKMSLKELCALKKGFIIQLNKKIGEPLDLIVDNKKIASCLPIKIDDSIGIKILNTINS